MSQADPVVVTLGGALRGATEDGLAVFRAVPYAAPPVGSLRWEVARPHAGWAGVRDAQQYGPSAPQPYAPGGSPIMGSNGEPPFDEDCLTVNIWSPDIDEKLPVLVWIHGGGFLAGSGNLPFYAGDATAHEGIVHVTVNYRIGALGLLHGMGSSANVWLTDQMLALRWIADNIASFGGDPRRITLAGQSGGAFSAAALIGHPATSPLIDRAILMSPPMGVELADPGAAFERTKTLARLLGHDDVEGLRSEPWERLVDGSIGVLREYDEYGEWGLAFEPVLDASTLAAHPVETLSNSSIDLVLGLTRDEATCAFELDRALDETTRAEVISWLGRRHGPDAASLYDVYANRRPGIAPKRVLTDVLTDDLFRRGTVEVAERRATRAPVRIYQFEVESPLFEGALGATHSLDMAFALDNFAAWGTSPFLQGIDPALCSSAAGVLHRAVVGFVRGEDLTASPFSWPCFEPADRIGLVIDESPSPRAGASWLGGLAGSRGVSFVTYVMNSSHT